MKRKLPITLKLTRQCALKEKIKPFKKWTSAQKRAVKACVARSLRTGSMGSSKKK